MQGGWPRERTPALQGKTGSSRTSQPGTASGGTILAKSNGDTAILFSSSPTERQLPCRFTAGMRQSANAITCLFPTPFTALKLLLVSPGASSPPRCIPNRNAAIHSAQLRASPPFPTKAPHAPRNSPGWCYEGEDREGEVGHNVPGASQDRNEELGDGESRNGVFIFFKHWYLEIARVLSVCYSPHLTGF